MTTKAEHQQAIMDFVEITGTDNGWAYTFLSKVDYDVEEAVMRYYSAMEIKLPSKEIPEDEDYIEPTISTSSDMIMVTEKLSTNQQDEFEEIRNLIWPNNTLLTQQLEHAYTNDNKHFGSSLDIIDSDRLLKIPNEVTILSYYIAGLDETELQTRFLGVLAIVKRVKPEILFLQECVKDIESKLKEVLGQKYNIFTGYRGSHYFTATCVAKCINIKKYEIVEFASTQMGRNMLCVEAKWDDLNVSLINSNLETGSNQMETRKWQFDCAMEKLKSYASQSNTLSIFGGCLNLRKSEVLNIPDGIEDAWIKSGSNSTSKYTLDTTKNDNTKTKKPLRQRLDRLFFKGPYQELGFSLEGKQRIENCGRFPSSHFAIVTKFSTPTTE